jgi:uncharacterized protein YbcC (UPF0753/DUF2309 family)
MSESAAQAGDVRQQIREAIHHLEHLLPGQAPIKGFVHHNTLHGFEHLPFPQALAEAHRITGNYGYLSAEQFRALYAAGRIDRDDLEQAMFETPGLEPEEILVPGEGPLTRGDVYRTALLYPLPALTPCQLTWQMEELRALERLQDDVPASARQRLLAEAGGEGVRDEPAAVADLWEACLQASGLEDFLVHPEELVDLSAEQAERMFERLAKEGAPDDQPLTQRAMQRDAAAGLGALLDRVGPELTLRGLLRELSGEDLLDELRPHLLRHLGAWLDQGIAAWSPADVEQGFYRTWRESAAHDPGELFEGLEDWRNHIQSLPEDPMDTVIAELGRLGLAREHWPSYLQRLALELPGWSGMTLWRQRHPDHAGRPEPVNLLDYLAVRLVLERVFARRLSARLWRVEPTLDMLRWYFHRNLSEFLVRQALYAGRRHLAEYLATQAQRLTQPLEGESGGAASGGWSQMARLIRTWQQSPAARRPEGHSIYRSVWRLFRLVQHLGWSGARVRALSADQVERLFETLGRLDPETSGFLWLRAYERRYREELLNALSANRGRGPWAERHRRPEAQLVFCMDDREEGIRRHLEEINPAIETLGAAAHFGVPHWWRGLDDTRRTGQCPVVTVPSHEVSERPRPGCDPQYRRHARRRAWRVRLRDGLHQELRRNLLSSSLGMAAAAPVAGLSLAAKVFAPRLFGRWARRLQGRFEQAVPTELAFTAERPKASPSPEEVQLGFSTAEQAARVGGFLRAIGLAHGFASLVVIMGHGSDSQNNPHLSAYNCGACSGNHSGPNARLFAAMANRPEVRAAVCEQGIDIPDDCWFLGAEHNTCDEEISWYDLDRVPEQLQAARDRLLEEVSRACVGSAHERARKFASAPSDPDPLRAYRHIVGRGYDFSQARPELGHATNAAAVIGRRSITSGAFFDRRLFLISYDHTRDPDGEILESLLLANGPVGAGINLEYYFSTVNNDGYGCGSKVTHNVTGLFGVMEGTASDLRTGLPRQMIDIHEAMRLLVVVEAGLEVLNAIYSRQPPLHELIGNGWLILAAMDPRSGALHLFRPDSGWESWQGEVRPLPVVKRSADYYPGTMKPLAPVLLEVPSKAGG